LIGQCSDIEETSRPLVVKTVPNNQGNGTTHITALFEFVGLFI